MSAMKHGSTLSLSGSVYSDGSGTIAVIETKEEQIAKMRGQKGQNSKNKKKNL